jgi:D-glycero-beta-D-manno-heptose-7-phosphate kinase
MKKEEIGNLFKNSRILVIGDLILDRFISGNVRRISPEAPVPVVEVVSERSALGGAANVANNIKALGGKPVLIGTIGDDSWGKEFFGALKKSGLESGGIVVRKKGATIVKTRVMAHHQQVVRVDRENIAAISAVWQLKIKQSIEKNLKDTKAVVVSDYAKGTFSKELLKWIGEKASAKKIPYIVDPKPANFPYPKATIVTPNRGEAQGFMNKPVSSENLLSFAKELLSKTDWKAVLLTLGDEGMALYERGSAKIELIPARVREVYDVTGAGDTVVAVMSLALASKLSFKDAALLANSAASVVVGKLGTATCSIEELKRNL